MFKIGDLVRYAPHSEGVGAWLMKAEIGVIVEVKNLSDGDQIVKVRWTTGEKSCDMACNVLKKMEII